jgi:hypothetical protein
MATGVVCRGQGTDLGGMVSGGDDWGWRHGRGGLGGGVPLRLGR